MTVNLNREENAALKALAGDDTVVIKQADKGSSLVILNRMDYDFEVKCQLSDIEAYKKIHIDPTSSILDLIKITVKEPLSLDYIDKPLSDYLVNEYPRVRVFNCLPKIRKPGFPPVGRPIVSTKGSLMEPISSCIDSILQPFHPSYWIKGTLLTKQF